jgi:hypothetical protein
LVAEQYNQLMIGRVSKLVAHIAAYTSLLRIAFASFLLLLIAINATSKGGTVDIYALIERVVLEPNDVAPERIQIWGAFAFDRPGDWNPPTGRGYPPNQPRRGYLYFRLPTVETEARAARSEWAELKTIAGTGQAIAFGRIHLGYFGMMRNQHEGDFIDSNGFVFSAMAGEESVRIRKESAAPRDPVTYPSSAGIVKLTNTGNFGVLLAQLKEALQP